MMVSYGNALYIEYFEIFGDEFGLHVGNHGTHELSLSGKEEEEDVKKREKVMSGKQSVVHWVNDRPEASKVQGIETRLESCDWPRGMHVMDRQDLALLLSDYARSGRRRLPYSFEPCECPFELSVFPFRPNGLLFRYMGNRVEGQRTTKGPHAITLCNMRQFCVLLRSCCR